jgi:hypothetical protein
VFVSLFAWTPVVLSARLHYCVYLGSGRPMPLQAVLGLTSLSAPHPSSRFPPVTVSFSFYLSLTHSAALNASNYLSLSVPRPPDPNRHFDLKSANTHSPVVLNAVVIRRGTRRLPKFRPAEFNLGDMFFVLIADRLWRSTLTQADLDAGL